MPRRARVLVQGVPLHIIQRGHNRQRCFYQDSDYLVYLDWLRKYASGMGASLHAYVLMTNHVHLLASFDDVKLVPDFMKAVGQKYAQYLNHRLNRCGALWQGRYRSCLVPGEQYFMRCQRYVECNPLRAGMVRQAAEYIWSSYRANAGLREDSLITPHALYLALGADASSRHENYRCLIAQDIDPAHLDEIRRATNGNVPLGSLPKKSGRPKKQPS